MFAWNAYSPSAPESGVWDAVIVGAGMGGSVVGYRLAQLGWRVLFIERGLPVDPFAPPPIRSRGMAHLLAASADDDAAMEASGRWSRRSNLTVNGRALQKHLPQGSGPGGSSAIYGATLERFLREDFRAAADHDTELTPLANAWPIPYEAMLPYYRAAETLFGVFGDRDPADPDDDFTSRSGPAMSPRDAEFFRIIEKAGLVPHRMRMALANKPGCGDCFGRLCARDCKGDGASRALKPALSQHNAALLAGCEVDRLIIAGDRVEGVVCRRGEETLRIRGRTVVLAGGAYASPAILLRSANEAWPHGVGNGFDLVGRGLMFHALQILAIWPPTPASTAGPARTLSARGFNVVDGVRLGVLQSLSQHVSVAQIWTFLLDLVASTIPPLADLARIPAAAIAVLSSRVFRNAGLFALLSEDFAYLENRVRLDPESDSGLAIEYRTTRGLRRRAAALRALLKQRLAPHRVVFLSSGPSPNFGHVCGTCRMSLTPSDGVTDCDGRVHGVQNLFIADSSVLPGSAATNPSLTIAANALRVADRIAVLEPAATESLSAVTV